MDILFSVLAEGRRQVQIRGLLAYITSAKQMARIWRLFFLLHRLERLDCCLWEDILKRGKKASGIRLAVDRDSYHKT